jgi:hypothetical protein
MKTFSGLVRCARRGTTLGAAGRSSDDSSLMSARDGRDSNASLAPGLIAAALSAVS